MNENAKMFDYFVSQNADVIDENDGKVIAKFSDVASEVDILFHGAAVRYLSRYSILELKGVDALDFLHRITTNSIKDLKKEQVAQTIFTNEKGRILSLSTILNFDTYQFIVCGEPNKSKITSWISKYIIADDVTIADVSDRFNILELSGGQADSFITLVCGSVVNEIEPNSFKVISTEGIMFFLVKLYEFNGRTKFWILADDDNAIKLLKYMKENHGIFNFGLVGETAYTEYRIKAGIPTAPNEINDQYNPYEANLKHLIDFKKGCYIGQEVIARLDTYDKVQKQLTGIKFQEEVDANEKFTLLDKEQNEIGIITSLAYSEKHKKYIGLGYIKKSHFQSGKIVTAKNSTKVTNIILQEIAQK